MALFRNKDELLREFSDFKALFDKGWKDKSITALIDEFSDLESIVSMPDFWDDPDKARELSRKKSLLEERLEPWKNLKIQVDDFPDLVELTMEEFSVPREALDSLEEEYSKMNQMFEDLLMSEALAGPDDARNAIVTITCGAGGTESQDWADMLYRMYLRWFESRGFSIETVDYQDGEEAGIKGATVIVRGDHPFGYLKSENGVHRLVRISPFDSNKRRHTSFASVHVSPEIDDDIDVQIEDKDMRVDTYRASGAGGQHINKTDSAIRITHIPTGIVVQCQNERSQMKNRSTAMKMLKARLYELEREKIEEDIEARSGEKKDVAWGSQIRSYVFHPYKMVKDLRTNHETGNVDAVMDGDLDPFITAYLKKISGGNVPVKDKSAE
ncbi:MAG: peptide chain release factor 2 [Spirochaetia bacterium]|nr:peptide chain release factor 2 [Spirochaetia bacterium]